MDDEILLEMDVFVSTQLAPYMSVLQFPGNLPELEASLGADGSIQGRCKPHSKLVELEFPLDTGHPTFDRGRAEELGQAASEGRIRSATGIYGSTREMVSKLCLQGSSFVPSPLSSSQSGKQFFVAYSLGMGVDASLHLTPVEQVLVMKPQLTFLDEGDRQTVTTAKRLDQEALHKEGELKAVQVQYRRKETEEQMAARLSSHAYQQRLIDDEPWIDMVHFLPSVPINVS